MDIKPIRTEQDYDAALARVDELMDAELGTPAGEELDVLVDLVEAYESRHVPMGYPSAVEAIEFRMEQDGLEPARSGPLHGQPREGLGGALPANARSRCRWPVPSTSTSAFPPKCCCVRLGINRRRSVSRPGVESIPPQGDGQTKMDP